LGLERWVALGDFAKPKKKNKKKSEEPLPRKEVLGGRNYVRGLIRKERPPGLDRVGRKGEGRDLEKKVPKREGDSAEEKKSPGLKTMRSQADEGMGKEGREVWDHK